MRAKVIFDLSEVLIGGFYGFEQVIAKAEGVSRELVRPVVAGPQLWRLCSGEIDEDAYLRHVRETGGWRKLSIEEMKREIRLLFRETMPGMPEYLMGLSKRCDLYMLSDHAREWIPDVVETHAFLAVFKKRYYSFEVGSVKREGKPFRFVLEDLGVEAEELFFVDDSTANVGKAREHGIRAHVFKSRELLEPELEGWLRGREGNH